MEILEITGGRKIRGEISLSGAKNAALPILFGSLLCSDPVEIENVPSDLEDIRVTIELIGELGAGVEVEGKTVRIDPSGVNVTDPPHELTSRIRSSLLLLSILLVRLGRVKLSLPGGCAIGKRKFDLHIAGLSAMGAEIESDQSGISGTREEEFTGADIDFYTPTVTGTENVILGACMASGTTRIKNANTVPEISDFAAFMNSMGARVRVSSRYIEIEGVDELRGTRYRVMDGNDEAVTYMIAAGMTGGEVKINNFNLSTIKADVQYLREAGMQIFEWGENVYVSGSKELRAFDMFTAPYPGVNSDLQPLFSALALAAPGESTITDQVFMERFEYVKQLRAFGADIRNFGNCAVIHGGKPIKGTDVTATDLRGGTAMVLAGLMAEGRTVVRNIYQIDRGYEKIEEKLGKLNADIHRVEIS